MPIDFAISNGKREMGKKAAVPSLVKSKEIEAGALFWLATDSVEDVENFVEDFFAEEGYKLEKGEPGDGRYAKGNAILRLLLGAFYPRHAFNVVVEETSKGQLEVSIVRAESGYAGGLIGRNQVLKEEKRILDEFEEALG